MGDFIKILAGLLVNDKLFLNQAWFWTSLFGAVGILGVVIKELLASKTILKAERLRLHEQEKFLAYKKLYNFVSGMADALFPPNEPRRDFIAEMKLYREHIKPNMLFFIPEIRKILKDFEDQYSALSNPDIILKINFTDFVDKHLFSSLESLQKMIEKQTDSILF